ncbi:hypothetical protein [Amycolatopsis sp. DSM 110486]|uniref:hypothetical protein n=1 Tax=Amycolatopsis sp. DSM 110486 TaxID=2865832 RepID=UPI001C6A2656|nr:hypothetical protein [Amycolatopsis sp. DSM 110486]QYN17442.1 hypothetical protein K1T34_32160 [Amycolatopsis sp. DSM 110486]
MRTVGTLLAASTLAVAAAIYIIDRRIGALLDSKAEAVTVRRLRKDMEAMREERLSYATAS